MKPTTAIAGHAVAKKFDYILATILRGLIDRMPEGGSGCPGTRAAREV